MQDYLAKGIRDTALAAKTRVNNLLWSDNGSIFLRRPLPAHIQEYCVVDVAYFPFLFRLLYLVLRRLGKLGKADAYQGLQVWVLVESAKRVLQCQYNVKQEWGSEKAVTSIASQWTASARPRLVDQTPWKSQQQAIRQR